MTSGAKPASGNLRNPACSTPCGMSTDKPRPKPSAAYVSTRSVEFASTVTGHWRPRRRNSVWKRRVSVACSPKAMSGCGIGSFVQSSRAERMGESARARSTSGSFSEGAGFQAGGGLAVQLGERQVDLLLGEEVFRFRLILPG